MFKRFYKLGAERCISNTTKIKTEEKPASENIIATSDFFVVSAAILNSIVSYSYVMGCLGDN